MKRPITSRMHGYIDYVAAGTMLILPRALGWGDNATLLLTVMGIGLAAYALITRYELGLFRFLPMKAHLILDGLAAVTLCFAPFLFLGDESDAVRLTIFALGLFELGTTLMTDPRTSLDHPHGHPTDAGGRVSHA